MGSMKVQVLYDFVAEPGSLELSIREGEILTVIRQDIGEGWWEGKNSKGDIGIFPAAYVVNYNTQDFWGDEEWDDEESTSSNIDNQFTSRPQNSVQNVTTQSIVPSNRIGVKPAPSVKRSYTNFAKSGVENFLLSTNKIAIPDDEKVTIVDTDGYLAWSPAFEAYTCTVTSPKKESKLKGFKSFIVYQLTPSFNNIQVSRRYKHFDWLHERLVVKYSLIPIPPLPEKQIYGRYEEMLIEHRKYQLQAFVDCVCRHPVLSRSSVWLHFITCTDEKLWKIGKRKAEKDELVGANFFHAVETPDVSVNYIYLEKETSNCQKFVNIVDSAVKNLMDVSMDQTKKYHGPWKREFQKIGQAFFALGQSMSCDIPELVNTSNLTDALKKTGDSYNEIGKMFEDQPRLDWKPVTDMLHVYKGILSFLPEILSNHRKALQTKKDCERSAFDQKMTSENLDEVNKKTDVISYSVLAEINHFHRDRAEDVTKTIKSFLKEQIIFYQRITEKLQEAYNAFEN